MHQQLFYHVRTSFLTLLVVMCDYQKWKIVSFYSRSNSINTKNILSSPTIEAKTFLRIPKIMTDQKFFFYSTKKNTDVRAWISQPSFVKMVSFAIRTSTNARMDDIEKRKKSLNKEWTDGRPREAFLKYFHFFNHLLEICWIFYKKSPYSIDRTCWNRKKSFFYMWSSYYCFFYLKLNHPIDIESFYKLVFLPYNFPKFGSNKLKKMNCFYLCSQQNCLGINYE